ncbi:hypothetical protein [Lyngbya sp. CCY1209]|uniref:hypothetical protein n=1 Tax=Lyngbya sp. CCY1209 TaxID=2886103 RepID=UPI002D1FFB96|nr:hypothetical protein [Lyngbya sp. CCY1209]MEB3885447.1 hypothetical protein [Lyngbya sp. CCY1209]
MPTIFELFGFPVDDHRSEVEAIRKSCQCPFMGTTCDGGGNRSQTKIKLTREEPLTSYFDKNLKKVIPGVCSIQAGEEVWVVCPRRLFAAKFDGKGTPPVNRSIQEHERSLLLNSGLPSNIEIGSWAEVSLKHQVKDADINYHFDYILAPLVETSVNALLNQGGFPGSTTSDLNNIVKIVKKSGHFSGINKNLADALIPLPDLSDLFILEVMTASTSGSNTEKSTDIKNAFRNALLSTEHACPGINKRQVWGRMVTQLFAKTALAHKWNGRTIWIIQDSLLHNIELTTRLRTADITDHKNRNINLAIMHYSTNESGTTQMSLKSTIEGDAGIDFDGNDTFTDILLPKFAPPKIELLKAILRRKVDAIFRL